MQHSTIDEVWTSYLRKVKLEHDGEVLAEYLRILNHFRVFLGDSRPNAEKAREYLQRFIQRSRNTQARYTDIINGILEWCGEEKVKRVKTPKRQPRYVPEGEYKTFFDKIGNKRSHKKSVERDILMFQVMDAAGLRCDEAATLRVCDLFLDGYYRDEPYLIAHGKGDKDRAVPLTVQMAQKILAFIKGKMSKDFVFGLKTKSVINKFYVWKKKAGVSISAHDLRRHFATDMGELNVPIRTTQQLMGHEDVTTTERYMAVPPAAARAAIELRGKKHSNIDPIMVDVRQALDPTNLIQALKPESVKDFSKLPAYWLRR